MAKSLETRPPAQSAGPSGSLSRGLAIVRILAEAPDAGLRLKEIASKTGMAQPTAHRLLKTLMDENVAEQTASGKAYRLCVAFYALAARAGCGYSTLRALCHPALLRLSGVLNETVFLMVRSGFDVLCFDRVEGPLPIRSYTSDIGGRIPLGLGQAGTLILALLPPQEQEEIIRFNTPRLRHLGFIDEVHLRAQIAQAKTQHYAVSQGQGLIQGMGGVAVPITDINGRTVAALSIGTLSERLNDERLPHVLDILQREAQTISRQINPFDPALGRPAHYLGPAHAPSP
ncbi:IclR family transcriptional regulator [Castellaniella hirudinis]|uniref:IclR family transcriptional regulator n=1 Tax=Castellaniella hirudinis TaxID=1144617 RepID=UPI0039C46A57